MTAGRPAPSLSVCIPTFNPDTEHLAQLLDSVYRQRLDDVDVVVSDDASDNQDDVRDMLRTRYPSVRWTGSPERLGMVSNWNRALEMGHGRYLALPGQDDVYPEGALGRAVTVLDRQGADVAFTFGAQRYVGADGGGRRRLGRAASSDRVWPAGELTVDGTDLVAIGLLYGNVIGDPCGVLLRASAYATSGGFDGRFRHAADLELWLRLGAQGARAVRIDEPIGWRRVHDSNATWAHIEAGLAGADRQQLLERYGRLLGPRERRRAMARVLLHRWFDRARSATVLDGAWWPEAHWADLVGPLARVILEDARLLPPAGRRRFR